MNEIAGGPPDLPTMVLGLFRTSTGRLRERMEGVLGNRISTYPFHEIVGGVMEEGESDVLELVRKALDVAPRVAFDLTGLDARQVHSDWDNDIYPHTTQELRIVLSVPKWRTKTSFYMFGRLISVNAVREEYDPHYRIELATRERDPARHHSPGRKGRKS